MALKKNLRSLTPTIGSWITIPHPSIVEILSRAGFDWLTVDMEHTATGYESAQIIISTIQANNMQALVRVAKNDDVLIKRSMDIGADGVIVPNICSAEDARKAVNHVRYPTTGTRGVGLFRAQKYGYGFEDYKKWLDNESVIIAQIEHVDAVKNIEAILAVEEVDGFIIGPYDLSASMGYPGEFERQDVKNKINEVREACIKAGRALGFHSVPTDEKPLIEKFSQGFTFGAYSLDFYFLGDRAMEGMNKIKRGLNEKS